MVSSPDIDEPVLPLPQKGIVMRRSSMAVRNRSAHQSMSSSHSLPLPVSQRNSFNAEVLPQNVSKPKPLSQQSQEKSRASAKSVLRSSTSSEVQKNQDNAADAEITSDKEDMESQENINAEGA